MKTIIAGSRGITSYDILLKIIKDSGYNITEVVSGTAAGVDQLGERWAEANNIPIKKFPADWSKGKGAGYARNFQMAFYADQAIILHDGESKGTQHMLNIMKEFSKPVYYATVKKKSAFSPENIDALIAEAKKIPYVGSALFISALEYIKKNINV